MKSPITGKEMILQEEPLVVTVDGESRRYLQLNFLCLDSGETFTTTKLDDINTWRLNNKYELT